MATVAQLLGVLQVTMATSQPHHGCLGIVERGGLVVQAVGVKHVELLQLIKQQTKYMINNTIHENIC